MKLFTFKEFTLLCGLIALSMFINSARAVEMPVLYASLGHVKISPSEKMHLGNKDVIELTSRSQFSFPVPVKNVETCNECHNSKVPKSKITHI